MVSAKRIASVLIRECGYDREEAIETAKDMKESLEEAIANNDYTEVEKIFLENRVDLDYVVECLL